MILAEAIKDLFFPSSCVHCGRAFGEDGDGALCHSCERDLVFFAPPRCERCSLPALNSLCRRCRLHPPPYDRRVVLGAYDGVLESTVKAAKFGDDGAAASRLIARAIAAAPPGPYDAVIAIPSDHAFTGMLADALAEARSAHRADFILRDRSGARQGNLTRAERRVNAPKLYNRRDIFPGQSVLLVDDVVTTGATIEACAMLLRDGGAIRVDALAIAATPLRRRL